MMKVKQINFDFIELTVEKYKKSLVFKYEENVCGLNEKLLELVEISNIEHFKKIYKEKIISKIDTFKQDELLSIEIYYYRCQKLNTAIVAIEIGYKNRKLEVVIHEEGDYEYPKHTHFIYDFLRRQDKAKTIYVPEFDMYLCNFKDFNQVNGNYFRTYMFKNGKVVDLGTIGYDTSKFFGWYNYHKI